jgi:enamine deaminase RidA (YjgF/YER057c/UK114 family)
MGKRTLQRIKGTLEGIGALPTDKGTPTMKATNKDTERNNAALSKQMREAGLPVNSTADAADIEPEIQEQIDIILDRTDPER